MTIKTSSFSQGSGFKLAPDLNFPADINAGNATTALSSVVFDPSGGLTTALSLTGKFAIPILTLASLTSSESYTIKLTIDGVVIWNSSNSQPLVARPLLSSAQGNDITIFCESSFLLEVQSTIDNSVQLLYLARPIL